MKIDNKAKQIIEKEKDRSDSLLLNILPEQTAEELKDNGKVKAKRFDSVSVMFTDFKGFTSLSDRLSPEELVNSIDFYYSKFDDIIEKHGPLTKEEIQTFCGTQQKFNAFLSKGIGVDLAHGKIKCHVTAQEMMGRLSGLDLQIGQYHKRS